MVGQNVNTDANARNTEAIKESAPHEQTGHFRAPFLMAYTKVQASRKDSGQSMAKPYLSVLIDTYNHERFIEQAVASVLAQDFSAADREILVVDDGSTDRTPEILGKFGSQIRVLRKANGGQASAFNTGIPQCQGEIVAFLDGDDWWVPDKLSSVAKAMADHPEVGFVGHGIVNIFQDGSQSTDILRDGFSFQANEMAGAKLFRLRCSFLGTSRMSIRKPLLDRIGPVPEEICVQADEYLYTMAAVFSPTLILPLALTFYRWHEDNGFSFSALDPARLSRKQRSLETLVRTLSGRLHDAGVAPGVRRALLAFTQANADQLRLCLGDGWSWETYQTEWTMYRVAYPDAPVSHRLFKLLALIPALVVPPKQFYSAQRSLSQSELYRRIRSRCLPFPEMPHIQKEVQKRQ